MATQDKWRIRAAALSAAAGVFAAAFPLYVNNPFHIQGARELAVGLWVARYQHQIAGIAAVVALLTLAGLWRRAWVLAGISLTALAATWVNVYPLVFHRMDRPEFTEIAGAGLAEDAPVLAVAVRGEARAYPVPVLAYHHVVNDRLGGTAIAATW